MKRRKVSKLLQLSAFRLAFNASRQLLAVLWREDKWLFFCNFLILIPGVVPFVNAYIYAQIINFIVASLAGHPHPITQLIALIIARLVALVFQNLLFQLQRRTNMSLSTRIPLLFTQRLMGLLSVLDIETLEDSEFLSKLGNAKESASWRISNMLQDIFYSLQSLVEILVAAGSLIFLNWVFAAIIAVSAIPALMYQARNSKAVWNIWANNSGYRKRYMYLYYNVSHSSNAKELRLFNLSPYFANRAKELGEKFARDNIAALNKQFWLATVANLADAAGYAVVEIYMLLETLGRRLSLGSLTYYTTALSNYQNGISGLFRAMSSLMDDAQYTQEVFEVLAVKPTIVSSPHAVKLPHGQAPRIEFRNVSFKYPGGKANVLSGLSLTIEPGEKVAFVGENGAGKTTLIKLLCRFYDVTEGEILINGTDIKEIDLAGWYEQMGVLFQDFLRYEYALRDNIHFGRVSAELIMGDIIRAAESGGATDVAEALPRGYNQMLGKTFKRGIELSGGQWQKVALARAFYRNAPVLVLDEPTAAIDARAEHEIFRRVERLANDKTVLIISHRFSTVRNADKIYVIEHGRIAGSGSHHDLMERNGTYAELFKLQAEAYK